MKWLLLGFLLAANLAAWQSVFLNHKSSFINPVFYFLDVGQGDSQLIDFGPAEILIDGGSDARVLGQLEKILGPTDRYLDLVILTHPELDHFGGLIDVLERYEVGKFIDNGRQGPARAYKNLPEADLILAEGDKIHYKDYEIKILNPSPENINSEKLNDTSIVALLESPGLKVLYTGDIGFKVEDQIRKKYKLAVDILKVPHHGSKNSSGAKFLNEINPAVAVIGVGKNSYGHPNPKALERLGQAGATIYTTLDNGLIKLEVDKNRNLNVFSEK